jgi:uncharacterized protein (DUF433 family)
MKLSSIIQSDPDILHGTPVFRGTRVPVESLFWHLEEGITIDGFLSDFPGVTRNQCLAVIEAAAKILGSKKLVDLYENAA